MREVKLYRQGNRLHASFTEDCCYIQEVLTPDSDMYLEVVLVPKYGGPESVELTTDSFLDALDKLEEIST